jgi:hypothetical protein
MKKVLIISGVTLAVIVGSFAACTAAVGNSLDNQTPTAVTPGTAPTAKHTIQVDLAAGSRSNVQITLGLAPSEQRVLAAGETFSKTYQVDEVPSYLFTSIDSVAVDSNAKPSVCKITVDGVLRSENSNPFIASCS